MERMCAMVLAILTVYWAPTVADAPLSAYHEHLFDLLAPVNIHLSQRGRVMGVLMR